MRTSQWMGALSVGMLCLFGWSLTAHAQRQSNPNQPGQGGQQQVQPGQYGQQTQPGQNYDQNGDPTRGQGASADRSQLGKADREIAECVAIANHTELQIAQYARDRVKDDDVRKFVDAIIRDHQELAKELQKHGVTSQVTGSQDPNGRQQAQTAQYVPDQDQPSQNQGTRRQIRRGQSPPASSTEGTQYTVQRPVQEMQNQTTDRLNWQQIEQELSKQCVSSAKKELDDHDGNEVDECFVGMQIAAHQHMLDKLTVLRRHVASRELRSALYDGISTSEDHLEKAKELMKELARSEHHSEKSDSSRSSAEN